MATTTVVTLDLSPVVIHLKITRRDSFTYGFILKQNGSEIDLTGSTFVHAVNPVEDGSGSDLFSIAQSNVPTTNGLVQFTPSIANLTGTAGDYFHDVQWTNASADVRTVISGKFTLGKDIAD